MSPTWGWAPWLWSYCRSLFQSVAKHWLARRQLGEPAFHLALTHQVQQCPIDLPFAAAQGQHQFGMEEPAPGGLAQKPQQHVGATSRADDARGARVVVSCPLLVPALQLAKLPEHEGEGITIPAAAWQAFTDEHASLLQQIQLQGLQATDLPH